jgi:hypothetical protein
MARKSDDIEMKIEIGGGDDVAEAAVMPSEEGGQPGDDASLKDVAPTNDLGSTLQQIKEQASEEDETGTGTQTLRQIVGGDYLLTLVRNHIWLIMLVVVLTCIYVGVRYQCQEDVIEISRLEKELTDAKYKAMASSSTLTEMCRQSNVLRVLRENEDTLLQMPNQPPFIISIEEE